jgi:hypothetical protein
MNDSMRQRILDAHRRMIPALKSKKRMYRVWFRLNGKDECLEKFLIEARDEKEAEEQCKRQIESMGVHCGINIRHVARG